MDHLSVTSPIRILQDKIGRALALVRLVSPPAARVQLIAGRQLSGPQPSAVDRGRLGLQGHQELFRAIVAADAGLT